MKLSNSGKKLLAYKIEEFISGKISKEQYLIARKAVYAIENDVKNNKNLENKPEWVKTQYRNEALEMI